MPEAEAQGQASGQSSQGQGSQQSSGAASGASESTSSQATQSSSQSQATTRPAYVPDDHWDATAGKVKDEAAFAKYVNDHVAFKAAEDSRKLTLPQKPEDYKLALSPSFKAPEGIEFVPDEKDPLLPQARAFAQKHGLTQDAFSELLDLHAAGQVGSQQSIKDAKAAEVQKLGVTGPARKTAVDTWLKAQLGDELGKHVSEFTFTARQVEAFEKIMANFRTQGGSGYTPQHRDEQQPGKLSNEEYEKLSMAERDAYARKFPQPQLNGR